MNESENVLDVVTPFGLRVHCSAAYWERITAIKHPAMRGRLEDVRLTLADPDEARRSVRDPAVILLYRRIEPRWVCAVVMRRDGDGYLITAYPADKIKADDALWRR